MAGVTVLYDEECGFCTALARWLERRGVGIAPIGSATGDMLLRDLTDEVRYATMHAVDRRGRRASGGAALPVILRELPGGRLAAAVCTLLPGPVDALYRVVVRHRSRISRWLGTQLPSSGASRPRPASRSPANSAPSRHGDGTDPSPDRR